MGHPDYVHFARRHRPHIHPLGAVLFLTYRFAGTVPKETVRLYKAKGDWLRKEVTRITKLDRVIRNDRFRSTVLYVLNNPVKAGLVSDWSDWQWNYLRESLSEEF